MNVQTGTAGLDAGKARLPAESPLAMPEQSLREGGLRVRRHRTSPRLIGLRRLYLLAGTAAMTAVALS
jgi:membrane glycosyltransferase